MMRVEPSPYVSASTATGRSESSSDHPLAQRHLQLDNEIVCVCYWIPWMVVIDGTLGKLSLKILSVITCAPNHKTKPCGDL